MANIKQQKKRIRTAERQRMENLRYRSTAKTLFRRLQDAVNASDKDEATSVHKELVRTLDKAAAKNVMHANTASRKKARAARMLVAEPVKETKATRRPKKKAAPRAAAKPSAAKAKAAEAKAAEAAAEATADEATEAVAETKAPAKKAPAKKAAPKAKAADKAPADDAPAADDAAPATDEATDE